MTRLARLLVTVSIPVLFAAALLAGSVPLPAVAVVLSVMGMVNHVGAVIAMGRGRAAEDRRGPAVDLAGSALAVAVFWVTSLAAVLGAAVAAGAMTAHRHWAATRGE